MQKVYLDTNPVFKAGEVAEFIGDLCKDDYEELLYNYDKSDPVTSFLIGLNMSEVCAMREDGSNKILALGGLTVYSTPGFYGVWLLCTEGAFKRPLTLYKYCKKILNNYEGVFGAFIYTPNKRHINFATKGFGFEKTANEEGKLALYVLQKK